MKALDLNALEKIDGDSWSWIGGAIGLIGLGIALTTTTARVGSLAWDGMMISAFGVGGSLGHFGYSLS
ncbi:hypothetical protein [Arenibacter amylolyticus]|uniref:hypothetical protein n=1 Tax=Arenibacter amylolyticus TaxID=1406873 RepID=UPI000A39ED00|nr:hypothetical protein [Arenibacter amylolyticus]